MALTSAMRSDSQAAPSIASLANRALHHLVGEARPHRHHARFVERVDDHQRDRQVEEGVAEGQHREGESGRGPLRGLAHRRSRLLACWRWKRAMGPTSSTKKADRHRRGERPVRVEEELVPQHLADHQRVGAAQKVGDDELADRRDEHQQAAGDDAGQGLRQGDGEEGDERAGAEIGRGFQRGWCRASPARRRAAAP